MPITLSHGITKPETNDTGPIIFPLLEDNWQQVNDHNHNGTNSAKLTGSSLQSTTQTLPNASWSLVSGGHYKQTVTMPVGFSFDTTTLQFRLTTLGHQVYPSVEKVTGTTFDVFFDANSLDLEVLFN